MPWRMQVASTTWAGLRMHARSLLGNEPLSECCHEFQHLLWLGPSYSISLETAEPAMMQVAKAWEAYGHGHGVLLVGMGACTRICMHKRHGARVHLTVMMPKGPADDCCCTCWRRMVARMSSSPDAEGSSYMQPRHWLGRRQARDMPYTTVLPTPLAAGNHAYVDAIDTYPCCCGVDATL